MRGEEELLQHSPDDDSDLCCSLRGNCMVWTAGVWVVEITVALRDAEAVQIWFFDDDSRMEYQYQYEYDQAPPCRDDYW
jgi:hypothetical protein